MPSYPGIPDQDYATLAKSYGELRSRPADVVAKTVPTFDEILVSGNLALVRLRWTATISQGSRTSTRHLKDFQVWRREPGNRWAFIRGMHYTESSSPSGGQEPDGQWRWVFDLGSVRPRRHESDLGT